MSGELGLLIIVATFGLVALASRQLGRYMVQIRLPLITGFLACGILAGPHVLGLISEEAPQRLRFLDQICLGFIALAAGNELNYRDLRSRLRSIVWVTAGLVVTTFTLGSCTLFLLSSRIPFMAEQPVAARLAIALLGGAILVARSPSSAIAVVNELRASGPFTQTVLGVTMLMDVVVITLFALNASVADALFTGAGVDLHFIGVVVLELGLSLALGLLLGKLVQLVLQGGLPQVVKATLVLMAGFCVFLLSDLVSEHSHRGVGVEVTIAPLLICMVGGFYLSNLTQFRPELTRMVRQLGPAIFILFFTLTGASLDLRVFMDTWVIALVLFGVRLSGIALGSFLGGTLAGDPPRNNRIAWMAFITQAGIGLGLAKQAAAQFPECGIPFATVMISVIVINQVTGPPFFKWAIQLVGEARHQRKGGTFKGPRDVLIFGLEDQSLALARQLRKHDWNPRIVSRMATSMDTAELRSTDASILPIEELTPEYLRELEADEAEAIVAMLSDEENERICGLAATHFPKARLVVRLHDPAKFARFHELGARIVEPNTAVIGLLENFVRAPVATSVMMGQEDGQEFIGVEMANPALEGTAIRDLSLPLDVHFLSIRRRGQPLVYGGYQTLKVGDFISMVGSVESLEKVKQLFDEPTSIS